MSGPWRTWDHVVKVDPDKPLVSGETFEDVCQTGTDALMIGGTTGITEAKMRRVIAACSKFDIPLFLEPNAPESVVHSQALDGYFVPTVLNANDIAWVVGFHKEWMRIDTQIDWRRTYPEAYLVLNPDSSVAEVTGANCEQSAEDIRAYARVTDQLFGLPILYLEYSGTYGDPEKVQAAATALEDASLFYGGGIHDYESAATMAAFADVVIVGDLLHREGCEAVAETVRGTADA